LHPIALDNEEIPLLTIEENLMNRDEKCIFSRREVIRLGAGAVLAAGLWPGRLLAADNGRGGSFTFVAINDMHFLSPRCPEWFARVSASIRSHKPLPEFCLAIGDLGEKGAQGELGPMRDVLRDLPMDYYTVIGNHDYITDTDRSVWEKLFPQRTNYQFRHRGWQFIGLDSTQGVEYEKTRIQPDTLSWLDSNLPQLNRTLPTVLFTHFPLGAGVMMRPANADDLLARFTDFNLVAVLNGHFHGYTEQVVKHASVTTNRCCSISRDNHDGSPEKGYFLCTAKDGAIHRQFIEVKLT
jgi:hypothetical protein